MFKDPRFNIGWPKTVPYHEGVDIKFNRLYASLEEEKMTSECRRNFAETVTEMENNPSGIVVRGWLHI